MLVESPQDLEQFEPGWDALAVAAARPYCAPAWLLAWWRHAAPAGGSLRTVVVLEQDGTVAGVAPYYAQRAPAGFTEYRLLGARTITRLGPVARPGAERAVAGVMAQVLHAAAPRPRAVRFEGADRDSPWPRLLQETWPGRLRPWRHFQVARPNPYITLAGRDYDGWFAARSSNFRQQMRRVARKVEAAGGRTRMTTAQEVERDLEQFARLHHARWNWRGGSGALHAGVEEMLCAAGRQLIAQGRFRLWTLEIDDQPVSSHLFVAAGGEVAYFNGGFDERFADLKPSLHTILVALEDCFARGERRMDLGLGMQPYKQRIADGDDPAAWMALFPRDARYPYTRLQAVPEVLGARARDVGRRLPAAVRDPIKAWLQARGR